MNKIKLKRYVVYDDKNSWYIHAEYKTRQSAIFCAVDLTSAGVKVHVVDKKDNAVIWG